MDPNYVSYPHWIEIRNLVTLLWAFPITAIGFAFMLLLSRAIIPSLVSSNHLPESVLKVRTFLYLISLVSLGLLIFVLVRATGLSDIIVDIYPKWWI